MHAKLSGETVSILQLWILHFLPVSVAEIVSKIEFKSTHNNLMQVSMGGLGEKKKNTSLFLSLLHQYLMMERLSKS